MCDTILEDVDYSAPAIRTLDMLPRKSRAIYEKCYTDFSKWCTTKKVKPYTESVLLAYFVERSKNIKASTLWAHYSMLKATIAAKDNVDLKNFSKVSAFLKKQSEGYKPKKSKILTRQQIDKFLVEAPNEIYLMTKVALIFGISGACRSTELIKLSINAVEVLDTAIIVTVKDTRTKRDRVFPIVTRVENPVDFVALCKEYMSLRKEDTEHSRFFVAYRNNKCSTMPVGRNQFGELPKRIATYLKLPDAASYTGHCFRRSACVLADTSDINFIRRCRGWKEPAAAERYEESSSSDQSKHTDSGFVSEEQTSTNYNSCRMPAASNNNTTQAETYRPSYPLPVVSQDSMASSFPDCSNQTIDITPMEIIKFEPDCNDESEPDPLSFSENDCLFLQLSEKYSEVSLPSSAWAFQFISGENHQLISLSEMIVTNDLENTIVRKKIIFTPDQIKVFIFDKQIDISVISDSDFISSLSELENIVKTFDNTAVCHGGMTIKEIPLNLINTSYVKDHNLDSWRHVSCTYLLTGGDVNNKQKICRFCDTATETIINFITGVKIQLNKSLKTSSARKK